MTSHRVMITGWVTVALLFGCDDGGREGPPPAEAGPEGGVLIFDAAMLRRDGGITPTDLGPPPMRDAGRRDSGPVDAFRPSTGYCSGYMSCFDIYTSGECISRDGCSWDGDCTGVASSCYYRNYSFTCNDQEGCYWSYSDETCRGTPRSCRSMTSQFSCTDQEGCRWTQECTGVAELCSENSTEGLCELEPGCTWNES